MFGSAGLLGRAMFERLCEVTPEHRIFPFDHTHADISNKQHVKELVRYIEPTTVINCASISTPELCENAQAGAFETNSVGPKILAEECDRIGAKLVHFSTCSVFKGDRYRPYSERCKPSPVNAYGLSKLEGERSIQDIMSDYLIIRPGWIFHADAPNFLLDWVDRIDRRLTVTVDADVHGSPVFAMDLIDATKELIDRDAKGVYHVANSQAATWESLSDAFVQLIKGTGRIRAKEVSQGLEIPKYTVLSTKKYKSFTGISMRPWTYALKQCLFYMERYKP